MNGGMPSSRRWGRRWAGAPAGCFCRGRRATASWSISGRRITAMHWPAARRSSPSICMNTPITWTLAPRRPVMSTPSWVLSGGATPISTHEGVDITGRLGAKVHVIGVFIHIEGEDRRAAGQCMAVIRRPLIDQLAVARRPRQKHPAGAPAQRLPHRRELGMPPFIRAEVTRQSCSKHGARLAWLSEAVEVELVEDHRIGGDEFLTFESIHDEHRRSREIELRQLHSNGVESLDRPAVVVLVMADDQLFRQPFDPCRIAGQRFHYVGHGWLLVSYHRE